MEVSQKKSVTTQFLTATTAIIGAIIGLVLGNMIENFTTFIIPFTAGGFIYIAGSDLIPELHKERELSKSLCNYSGLF